MADATTTPKAPTTAGLVGDALLAAGHVNRTAFSLRAGLVAAVPVAGMLALGTAIGSPPVAVSSAIGAMLCGVAWRAAGPLAPPLWTMSGATAALALATLLGRITAPLPWLHLITLFCTCLAAGSLTVLGRPGALIGTQSLIAFIVFGRAPGDLGTAFGSALLVACGGVAQILFARSVALPAAWRRQRHAVAVAYEGLVDFAAGILAADAASTAMLLDEADSLLATPALLGDPKRQALSDLVDEGRRIRLELIALRSAVVRDRRRVGELADDNERELTEALRRLRRVLEVIAGVARAGCDETSELLTSSDELGAWLSSRDPAGDLWLNERLHAVVGQVRAAARLAAASEAVLPRGRPSLGSRRIWERAAFAGRRIRRGATLESGAGRHALRLAVVVTGTALLVEQWASLPRGYWAVVAVATVLRPEFAATFTRGAERVLGTVSGVVVCTLIAVAIDPSGWAVVVLVAMLAFATYAVFAASFTLGVAGITGVIVFLLHIVYPDSVQVAFDRGIDTLIGGAIGLVAYALWPTWSVNLTGRLVGNLIDSQRRYLRLVTSALVDGTPLREEDVKPLARAARVAWGDAASATELAASEPARDDSHPRRFAGALGALRRLVWGVHALRLEVAALGERPAMPHLEPLADALDGALSVIAGRVRDQPIGGPLPPLRHIYIDFHKSSDGRFQATLEPPLDELIDAVDTAGASVGVDPP